MWAYKYSAEPWTQIFAPLKIVHAKGGGSEKLSARMGNPCDGQLISIHVRLQFFDSSLRGFLSKDRVPLFEQPLSQLRDVFRVLNQVANLNPAHINSALCLTMIRRIFIKRHEDFMPERQTTFAELIFRRLQTRLEPRSRNLVKGSKRSRWPTTSGGNQMKDPSVLQFVNRRRSKSKSLNNEKNSKTQWPSRLGLDAGPP
jgi:hypothetical protein